MDRSGYPVKILQYGVNSLKSIDTVHAVFRMKGRRTAYKMEEVILIHWITDQ